VKVTALVATMAATLAMGMICTATAPIASAAYPITGKVWEATATVKAIRGSVTPAISQFNAVAPNRDAYRVLWQVASPTNISGATIPEGAESTGKIHFDVTGAPPTTITMNNGMEDLLIWGP
jgi:hypothetical protein